MTVKIHILSKKGGVLCGDDKDVQRVIYPFPGAYPSIVGTELYTRKRRKATCKKCLRVHGKLIQEKAVWRS